ncbi:MaoC family dehydratase [Smaragdicoccus niigatensis]|uniref:MaoC family dehydratase n=1 Tax=Smaragdicoccus niigatensis TaxID=359359 RepID=UPI00036EC6AF|nr:MaoC/PaaZ C-terminal domain-containing protein [Smaragdicoccus niigatensis]
MSSGTAVPLKLVRYQLPMIKTLGQIMVSSVLPGGRKSNPATFEPVTTTIDALPEALVDSYVAWSGATGDYSRTLPPHMFSQWAMPVASQILRQSRYNLASVLNQGVTMQVNGEIRRGEPIIVTARLHSLEETPTRARVSVALDSGNADNPTAVSAILHCVFPLPGPKEPKTERAEAPVAWKKVGTWRTESSDGFRFALLTGDFNPIHWIGLAGKMSPFGRTVLHGFGMFVRTYESLAASTPVHEIDVRFLKPVSLPSNDLSVEVGPADADGKSPVRLVSGDKLHMAGTFS